MRSLSRPPGCLWLKRASEARRQTEATRLANDFERPCERQRLGLEPMPREAADDTVGELLQWWLDAYPGATDSTQGKNLSTVRKHLLESSIAKIPAGN